MQKCSSTGKSGLKLQFSHASLVIIHASYLSNFKKKYSAISFDANFLKAFYYEFISLFDSDFL